MSRQSPNRDTAPPVQRLRLRYAKRGRLRFSSARDFQRALERALRRADVPMAYSGGFSPHPRISYANAAATGVASEAEYVELALVERCDPQAVRAALDAHDKALDAQVQAGRLTREQADWMDSRMEANIRAMVTRQFGPGRQGGPGSGPGAGPGFGPGIGPGRRGPGMMPGFGPWRQGQ